MLSQNLYAQIEAKTADFQIVPGDIGKTFTNRGASASVTATLPPVADLTAGWWCRFFVVANQAVVIASHGSSDNITGLNDATADSLTIDTSAERIGFGATFIWDGTSWLAFCNLAGDAQSVAFA